MYIYIYIHIIFYYIILCYINYIILYYSIVYYIIVHYIILFSYIILYYIILYIIFIIFIILYIQYIFYIHIISTRSSPVKKRELIAHRLGAILVASCIKSTSSIHFYSPSRKAFKACRRHAQKKRPTSNPHVLGPSETGEASIRDCEVLVF